MHQGRADWEWRVPNQHPLPVPQHSPFFAEQLTAFQVWLTMGVENRNPPEQLPIVLQVSVLRSRGLVSNFQGRNRSLGCVCGCATPVAVPSARWLSGHISQIPQKSLGPPADLLQKGLSGDV